MIGGWMVGWMMGGLDGMVNRSGVEEWRADRIKRFIDRTINAYHLNMSTSMC